MPLFSVAIASQTYSQKLLSQWQHFIFYAKESLWRSLTFKKVLLYTTVHYGCLSLAHVQEREISQHTFENGLHFSLSPGINPTEVWQDESFPTPQASSFLHQNPSIPSFIKQSQKNVMFSSFSKPAPFFLRDFERTPFPSLLPLTQKTPSLSPFDKSPEVIFEIPAQTTQPLFHKTQETPLQQLSAEESKNITFDTHTAVSLPQKEDILQLREKTSIAADLPLNEIMKSTEGSHASSALEIFASEPVLIATDPEVLLSMSSDNDEALTLAPTPSLEAAVITHDNEVLPLALPQPEAVPAVVFEAPVQEKVISFLDIAEAIPALLTPTTASLKTPPPSITEEIARLEEKLGLTERINGDDEDNHPYNIGFFSQGESGAKDLFFPVLSNSLIGETLKHAKEDVLKNKQEYCGKGTTHEFYQENFLKQHDPMTIGMLAYEVDKNITKNTPILHGFGGAKDDVDDLFRLAILKAKQPRAEGGLSLFEAKAFFYFESKNKIDDKIFSFQLTSEQADEIRHSGAYREKHQLGFGELPEITPAEVNKIQNETRSEIRQNAQFAMGYLLHKMEDDVKI